MGTAVERERSLPVGRREHSLLTEGLIGSPILKIAAEVRELMAKGEKVCNLTVGDFAPSEFPVPDLLSRELAAAVQKGETNYPPSTGMPGLRKAVMAFCDRRLGLRVENDGVLIAAGARPLIYAIYRVLVDPGESVVFPVPSWNNSHYCQMSGAVGVEVPCDASTSFLPTAAMLRPKLRDARLLVLNSPVNPTGTAFTRDHLAAICDAVLEENERRAGRDRPLYLMYDQVYWMLCFGDVVHVTPLELLPEMARYTLLVDGISKPFAATGLRVGWAVGPVDVIARMAAILGHVGAWAPRPEQVATVALLDDAEAIREFHAGFKRDVRARLDLLHDGVQSLKARGLPVESIPPMGAIYLTARIHPFGRRTPTGQVLETNEHVRRFVLDSAGVAVVPFQAFGATGDDGWFRLSVGAVGEQDIVSALPRLESALQSLA